MDWVGRRRNTTRSSMSPTLNVHWLCNWLRTRSSIEELAELKWQREQLDNLVCFSDPFQQLGFPCFPGCDIVPLLICLPLSSQAHHSCGKAKRRMGQKRATRKCSRYRCPSPLSISFSRRRAYSGLETNKLDDDQMLHAACTS